ncbi:hypothetical protein NQ314_002176 [Rhamnusium bicolor]|uniref:Nuclease HARBI1 n=1 Tax=Rhamnusium bicolor TaxID=1586634 RepID=A0AAV8ZSX9_9CUCU|nr:hypothetical protein NQ314_002176 [Rhamnusium bicolor]
MARANIDEDDFLEFVDVVEEVLQNERLPKRYFRDVENPLERFRDDEFQNRYRFSKDSVRHIILPMIQKQLMKTNNRGLPIPPLIQLLVCLRFFATGNFQVVSGDLRGISQATVSVIIKRVSELIAEQTAHFIKFPAEEALQRKNITKFWRISAFPGVAVCVDCTHIPIASPGGDNAEVYTNRIECAGCSWTPHGNSRHCCTSSWVNT